MHPSVQLRGREYRTLHQVQADVELICSNAITFNNKANKVYKNAQALLRGCRKQMATERASLLEAVATLHPGGPQVYPNNLNRVPGVAIVMNHYQHCLDAPGGLVENLSSISCLQPLLQGTELMWYRSSGSLAEDRYS